MTDDQLNLELNKIISDNLVFSKGKIISIGTPAVTKFVQQLLAEKEASWEKELGGFKVIKGDEVNSIHSAAMRNLSPEQLIHLRDKLIRRTPPIPEWEKEKQAQAVEFADFAYETREAMDYWEANISSDKSKYQILSELYQLFLNSKTKEG